MPRKGTIPHPTESELAILQVLWRQGTEFGAASLGRKLGGKSGYTTVLKFLQIMREKGLVSRDERESRHVYAAAVSRDQTQERMVGRLVERLFGGSMSQLVLRALSTRPVSADELKEIQSALAEEEKKRR